MTKCIKLIIDEFLNTKWKNDLKNQ